MKRDVKLVVLHQRAKSCDDDCAASRKSNQPRNIGAETQREIFLMQFPALLGGVFVEFFHRRLHQSKTTVISIQLHIAKKAGDVVEPGQVAVGGQNFKCGLSHSCTVARKFRMTKLMVFPK